MVGINLMSKAIDLLLVLIFVIVVLQRVFIPFTPFWLDGIVLVLIAIFFIASNKK